MTAETIDLFGAPNVDSVEREDARIIARTSSHSENANSITESEAQQLANILRMWVAVDCDGAVFAFSSLPKIDGTLWCSGVGNYFGAIPIRIASDRPWTKQIWRPE